MATNITYVLFSDGLGFHARAGDANIGEITFVRAGIDKLIIDSTAVDPEYRNSQIGLNLVRAVSDLARSQKRKIIAMCPFARAMFSRFSEFDDVRFMRNV